LYTIDFAVIVCTMTVVSKFGGSSLSNAKNIRRVCKIITSDPRRKYIVVSAPGKNNKRDTKVTDLLIKSFAQRRLDPLVATKFVEITTQLGLGSKLDIDSLINDINKGITNRDKYYTISRGEYIIAKILALYLGYKMIDATEIIMLDNFGKIVLKDCCTNLSQIKMNCVIPGFYGKNSDGQIVTLKRGGSDTTGAIVATCVDAAMYENWTDVNGVFDKNPKEKKDAKHIRFLTYDQMYNMSIKGASVLSSESINPVKQNKIPINIRNTFNIQDVGTIVASEFNPTFVKVDQIQ